ncbi:hypothetical protein GJW-30_1_04036 [Variibacter gotjawalensis]|uniref:O-Antigen ligase n=1 Tax=Variibacter gotjawalensis TaxID=1333996 RepID=A0A0S3PZW9_9BRAD|nr:hypothetical protein [Variibacter gotjawalensis]NIK47319.1 hypothetical protein [Variibacter gotjawalensis]RZS49217.1 hypothetical protein EV661_1643 [Variibacter gotjawalensis]BAT61479.1 hypothetical protein GJW-30_1_04036 [Variibacter gotjawalensis]
MDLEPIGFATIAACAAIFVYRVRFAVWALCLALPLGAAAAIKLPAAGGASILPSLLIALSLIAVVTLNPKLRAIALESARPPLPGFWMLAFTIYGIATAIFLPRIFAGMVNVYSLARVGEDIGIVSLPLSPRSSNITQSGYLVVTLLTFLSIQAIALAGGIRVIRAALLAAACATLFFAVADIITFYAGQAWLLGFIRNANYRMLEAGQIGGLKRIVGSFSEAGAYSYAALGFYAFTLSLWLNGVRPALNGTLAALLGISLLASTSSMAYVSIALFTAVILYGRIANLVAGRLTRQDSIFLFFMIVGPIGLIALIILAPALWSAVIDLYDATIVNKLATQSGIERMRWNEHAYRAFIATSGWGTGVGSVRASSAILANLSNVGIIGTLLFAAMIYSIVVYKGVARSEEQKTALAATHASLVLAIAACISAGGTDLGLIFAVFAGLAASAHSRAIAHHRIGPRFAYPSSPNSEPAAA